MVKKVMTVKAPKGKRLTSSKKKYETIILPVIKGNKSHYVILPSDLANSGISYIQIERVKL